MRGRYIPAAVRDPLGFPKQLLEEAAGPKALAIALDGATQHPLRLAGDSPFSTSTGSKFDTKMTQI
jgi:hypothetical protein